MRLKRNFFNRDTVIVARQLLGKYLRRRINGKVIRAKITETEAYCGTKDLACHTSKGLTPRTKIMFGSPGHAYIYMIYGMYHCFNVVTREEGCPEAVLIRRAEVVEVVSDQWSVTSKNKYSLSSKKLATDRRPPSTRLDGPGILCRELKIDKKLNGVDICKSRELWIEDNGEKVKLSQIKKGKRIGVDYAGKWKDKLWRFYLD